MKELIKRILKLSPIPLSRNHRYDLLTKKIIKSLHTDSNCIDVGCFKGEILDLMRQAAPQGQHFGVEPIPKMYQQLKKKYQHSNCTILNYAASNQAGTSSFNYVTSNPSYSGLLKRDYDKPNEVDESITVKTELLDKLIPLNIKIDLIKIDVEGAELLVLEGAQKIINTYKPIVIFEHGLGASEHYGATPDKIFAFFSAKEMSISNLSSYIKKQKPLSLEAFARQYHGKENYYFVAHQ